jgi:hypothetical protein
MSQIYVVNIDFSDIADGQVFTQGDGYKYIKLARGYKENSYCITNSQWVHFFPTEQCFITVLDNESLYREVRA